MGWVPRLPRPLELSMVGALARRTIGVREGNADVDATRQHS